MNIEVKVDGKSLGIFGFEDFRLQALIQSWSRDTEKVRKQLKRRGVITHVDFEGAIATMEQTHNEPDYPARKADGFD